MSEYQYYEFMTIDRPLTEGEMGELRGISTRADITTTSFINRVQLGRPQGQSGQAPPALFRCFCVCCQLGYAPARSTDSQRYH